MVSGSVYGACEWCVGAHGVCGAPYCPWCLVASMVHVNGALVPMVAVVSHSVHGVW